MGDGQYSPAAVGIFSALRIRNFRVLIGTTILTIGGYQMDLVARSWLTYDLFRSGSLLGLVMLTAGVSQLVFGMVGGVATDRFDKRNLMLFSQVVLMVVSLATGLLVDLRIIEVWHLMVLGAISGLAAFHFPARLAIMPEIVGQQRLASAISLDSGGRNSSRILMPTLAGVLLAWHPTSAFYLIAAMYGAATLLILTLPKSPGQKSSQGVLLQLGDGLRYVWQQRTLRTLMLLSLFPLILAFPYQQLLPVFQVSVLRVTPTHLGFMFAASGVGALVGSMSITRASNARARARMQLAFGVALGASLLLFALSTVYVFSLVMLFVVGFSLQGFLTLNNVLIMMNCERAWYGRVLGLYMSTIALTAMATMPLGALIDSIGAPTTMAAAGLVLVIVMGTSAVRSRGQSETAASITST